VLWILARWRVTGRERIPMQGPLIVVCNHLNNADPPIVGAGIARRRLRFMAKIELFKLPFGLFPRAYGAFPVRRFDADVAAMLNAERILRNGGVLGMFPEGTRSRTGYIGKPHLGTAMIALRSGATVLPCAITGTEVLRNPLNVLRRPVITFTIGEPVQLERIKRPSEEQVMQLTDQIFSAITAMLPPKYLPPYTGAEANEAADDGGDHPGD
jgi:1-acyl-sn-glycerol-3-phosphate acyltransferase